MLRKLLATRELGIILVLLSEAAIFAWLVRQPGHSNPFLAGDSILRLVRDSAVLGLAAIGSTLVIISGGIDLAVGSIIALVTVVTARLMAGPLQCGSALAVLLGLAAGTSCGLLSAWIITGAKLPPFIVTLGMLSTIRGVAFLLTDGRTIPLDRQAALARVIGEGKFQVGPFTVPVLALLLVLIALAYLWLMNRTTLGRAIVAVGGNEEAARLSGVPVRRVKLIVYGLAGLNAALAGIAYLGYYGTGQSTAARGWELDAIAAAVLGGASLSGGRGSVVGACIGAVIFRVLQKGLTMTGASSYEEVIVGLVVIIAVVLDQLTTARARRYGAG